MASWNVIIPAHDSAIFRDLVWLQHLCNAVNQRAAAWLATPTAGGEVAGGPGILVAAGDDIQRAAFWKEFQENLSILLRISPWLEPTPVNPAGSWFDGSMWNLWHEPSLRTSLGLHNGDFRIPPAVAEPPLWRTQCPRRVNLPNDATDDQGNTLENGHIAWLLGSPRAPLLAKRVGAIADPAAAPTLTPGTTGGRLGEGTYFVRYTYSSGIGETLASPESSVILPPGTTAGTIRVTTPAFPAAAKLIVVYLRISTDPVATMNDTSPSSTCLIPRLAGNSAPLPSVNWSQWVEAGPHDVPDLLDSNNPAAGADHVDPGLMQSGNYLTPQILIELRRVINALRWVSNPYPPIAAGTGIVTAGRGSTKAAASADYPDVAAPGFPFAAGGDVLGSSATSDDLSGGGGDEYMVQTTANTVTAQSGTAQAITADFYVRPEIDNTVAGAVFDAQGSDLTQNRWSLWTSVGPSALPMTSPPWPVVNPPNWPTPIAGAIATKGYTIQQNTTVYTDIVAVLKYDVPGGFDEQSSSP